MTFGNNAITDTTPRSELLKYAIGEVSNLISGEEFKLCDLFVPYEWRRLPTRGVRSVLGTEFFNYFFKPKNGEPEGLGLIQTRNGADGKTPQGQRVYQRI